MKRSPLARGRKPLARHKPLRSMSAKQRRKVDAEAPARAAVRERDGGCVLRFRQDEYGHCLGPLQAHHLRKAWTQASMSLFNGVALCERHNQWVESNHREARRLGLELGRGDSLWSAWARMARVGLPVTPPDPCCDLPGPDCDHGGAA